MSLIICPECGKEISDMAESCPGCGWPVVLEEDIIEDEEDIKQSGFGIASFVLSIVVLAFALADHFFFSNGVLFVAAFFRTIRNILCIIAFILGTVGMFAKHRTHGFAVAGNIISFIFLWM